MNIEEIILKHDNENLDVIEKSLTAGDINAEAAKYMSEQYSASMARFREIFYVLGNCFGAPKAAVVPYDARAGHVIDADIKISDINPLSAYLVNHRLDMDPMRNQFFATVENYKVDLLVSSIVGVIVGAQKSIRRALEKVTGKYYDSFVDEVADTAEQVLVESGRDASGRAIAQKIREEFSKKFITDASETVLRIIGGGHEKIAAEMVRRLDKITKPHIRLNDVWRVKCLFDMVPQAHTFMERIYESMPNRVIQIKDKFYEHKHPRNYRDAKIILNIGTEDVVVPLEIIVNIRTFFDFENGGTHAVYERVRGTGDESSKQMIDFREQGIVQYNKMIRHCVTELFDRVGWNILYKTESMFEGFPRVGRAYFPQNIVDAIMVKVDKMVNNEVFYVPDAPAKLTKVQTLEIFRWMTRFILVSVVPYANGYRGKSCDEMPKKLFNFVMTELHRYYKK